VSQNYARHSVFAQWRKIQKERHTEYRLALHLALNPPQTGHTVSLFKAVNISGFRRMSMLLWL
jgi:hypothetical protein